MTPEQLADRLHKDFPEWTHSQALTAAQAVYRASKKIAAELAQDNRPVLSMLERFLSRRVLELEAEVAAKDTTLSAVRAMVDAAYGDNDAHSRSAW